MSKNIKKILITGFSHSGTTVLRAIMGNISEIHEVIDETRTISENELKRAIKNNKKFILIKSPHIVSCLPIEQYNDFEIIFLMRDPYYVYSSINKRKINYYIVHNIPKYERAAKLFLDYSKNSEKYKNIHTIKYEELFENNFEKLKSIFNKIGLTYDDSIFDNTNRYHQSHSHVSYRSIKEKPDDSEHAKYRTWQINQPFVYNDNLSKIDLIETQIINLSKSSIINKLYPHSKSIVLDYINKTQNKNYKL